MYEGVCPRKKETNKRKEAKENLKENVSVLLSVVPYNPPRASYGLIEKGYKKDYRQGTRQLKIFIMDFETYWTLFRPDEQFEDRREAAEQEWNKHPEKHEAIIAWLRKHGAYRGRNPYFFIKDFQVKQPRQQVLTYSAYYAKYGTTEERDGWKMANPTGQQVIYIKN